ncbi:MAG: hypothetical protein AAFV86_24255 [Pseudomonadota bacterium]
MQTIASTTSPLVTAATTGARWLASALDALAWALIVNRHVAAAETQGLLDHERLQRIVDEADREMAARD